MVGEGVLHEALKHPDVKSVLVIGRKPCGVSHQKLTEIVHADFFDYSSIENRLEGYNACFFCLGVSSVGMNEKDYARVTYDLTMAAAKTLSRLNPDMTFCYVSGAGTNAEGRMMWQKVKGKTENDLTKLSFKSVYNFRPGFIRPTKGLKNAFRVAIVLGWFYPVLKLFAGKHVCTLEDLGLAMINVSERGYTKATVECEEIARLARREKA
jgi:uncharacterized protein YbjT (DUF2867 family)